MLGGYGGTKRAVAMNVSFRPASPRVRGPFPWQQGRDDAFTSRHPALKTSKGTLQLRPEDAAAIHDDELSDLVRAALAA